MRRPRPKTVPVPVPSTPNVPMPMLGPTPKPVGGIPMLGNLGVSQAPLVPAPPKTKVRPTAPKVAPVAKALASSVQKKSIFPSRPLSKAKSKQL